MDTLIPEQDDEEQLVPVKIIRRGGDVVLVEWIDEAGVPKRAWVATAQIVSEDEPNPKKGKPHSGIARSPTLGIPYGVEFSRLISVIATPQDIERELKRRGIWTVADLRADVPGVRAAIQAAIALTLADLLAAVKRYETEVRGAGETSPAP